MSRAPTLCYGCGAGIAFPPGTTTARCPYCRSIVHLTPTSVPLARGPIVPSTAATVPPPKSPAKAPVLPEHNLEVWSCPRCTLLNPQSRRDCEACGGQRAPAQAQGTATRPMPPPSQISALLAPPPARTMASSLPPPLPVMTAADIGAYLSGDDAVSSNRCSAAAEAAADALFMAIVDSALRTGVEFCDAAFPPCRASLGSAALHVTILPAGPGGGSGRKTRVPILWRRPPDLADEQRLFGLECTMPAPRALLDAAGGGAAPPTGSDCDALAACSQVCFVAPVLPPWGYVWPTPHVWPFPAPLESTRTHTCVILGPVPPPPLPTRCSRYRKTSERSQASSADPTSVRQAHQPGPFVQAPCLAEMSRRAPSGRAGSSRRWQSSLRTSLQSRGCFGTSLFSTHCGLAGQAETAAPVPRRSRRCSGHPPSSVRSLLLAAGSCKQRRGVTAAAAAPRSSLAPAPVMWLT
jgi:hypothetical protein